MHNPVYETGKFPLYYAAGSDIRLLDNETLLDQFNEVDAELCHLRTIIRDERKRIADAERLIENVARAASAQINDEPHTPSHDPVALLRRRSLVHLGGMALQASKKMMVATKRMDDARISQLALRPERRIHVEEMVERFLSPDQHTVTLEYADVLFVLDDRLPSVLVLRDG